MNMGSPHDQKTVLLLGTISVLAGNPRSVFLRSWAVGAAPHASGIQSSSSGTATSSSFATCGNYGMACQSQTVWIISGVNSSACNRFP